MGISTFSGCGKFFGDETSSTEEADNDEDDIKEKKSKKEKEKQKQDEEVKEEKVKEDKDNTAKTEEETVEKVKNPLKDYTTVYPGDLKEDDEETIKLIECFLSTCPGEVPALDTILGVTAADFDANGTNEAFIFAGEQDELGYYGSFYYVDGEKTVALGKNGVSTEDIEKIALYEFDGFIKFGNKVYFYFNEYYATAKLTYVFEVVDGEVEEALISRLGDLVFDNDHEFSVMDSSYDMTFDKDMANFLGHTWKYYYFKYDEKTDEIYECSGSHITVSDIDEVVGFDITEQLVNEGYGIIDAYKRSNDIVVINFFSNTDTSVDFYNISYDIAKKRFYGGWDNVNGTEDWKNAIAEGSCLFAISCMYENNGAEVYENLEIEVKYADDILCVMEQPYMIIGDIDGISRLFYVDSEADVSRIKGAKKYKIEVVNNTIKKIK